MRLPLFVVLAVFSGFVQAGTPIGRVFEVWGDVTVGADAIAVGYPLQDGNHFATGKDSRAKLRMADDAFVVIDADSSMLVDSFIFNPQQPATAQARYVLSRGTARLVSGVMSKLKPESVTLSTPYGDITTLGTDYTVGLCSGGCAEVPGLYLNVRAGQVKLSSADGSKAVVKAGQTVRLQAGGAPTILSQEPSFMASINADGFTAAFDARDTGGLRLTADMRAVGVTAPIDTRNPIPPPIPPQLGPDTQDFLDGVLDLPASPSQPVARAIR